MPPATPLVTRMRTGCCGHPSPGHGFPFWPAQSHPQGTSGTVLLPRSSGVTGRGEPGAAAARPHKQRSQGSPFCAGPRPPPRSLISVISGGDLRPLCAAPAPWMRLWSVVPGAWRGHGSPTRLIPAQGWGTCGEMRGTALPLPALVPGAAPGQLRQSSATWANGGQSPGTGSSESLKFPHRHSRLPEHVHSLLTAPRNTHTRAWGSHSPVRVLEVDIDFLC